MTGQKEGHTGRGKDHMWKKGAFCGQTKFRNHKEGEEKGKEGIEMTIKDGK